MFSNNNYGMMFVALLLLKCFTSEVYSGESTTEKVDIYNRQNMFLFKRVEFCMLSRKKRTRQPFDRGVYQNLQIIVFHSIFFCGIFRNKRCIYHVFL